MGKDKGLDFSHFDPKFSSDLEKVGPEFDDLYEKRENFIKANRGIYVPQPFVPQNISGLVPLLNKSLPSTRSLFTRTTYFERNGFFNVHTPVLNTRLKPWLFFGFLVWGWTAFQVGGWNYEHYYDNGERRNTLYWKLQSVDLPNTKMWQRPG